MRRVWLRIRSDWDYLDNKILCKTNPNYYFEFLVVFSFILCTNFWNKWFVEFACGKFYFICIHSNSSIVFFLLNRKLLFIIFEVLLIIFKINITSCILYWKLIL